MDIARPMVRDEDPRPWLEIRRTLKLRQQHGTSRWLPELIVIVFVLLMSVSSAWWAGSKLEPDLSGLTVTIQSLAPPRAQPEHRIVGYTAQQGSLAADPSQPGIPF